MAQRAVATDSPGLSNRVPYRLKITTAGYRGAQVLELLTTQAVAGVLRLDDIALAITPPPTLTYLLAAALGQIGGPAGPLDDSGQLPSAQVPAVGGITVHAMLSGLTADDHPHYLTQDRGDARYYTQTQINDQLNALVPTTRQINAGTGLSGGGTLTTDRTLAVAYGTTTGTAAAGNDARLADPRTPTGPAGGSLTATYPDPTIAAGAVGSAEIATAIKDPAAGTAGLRTLGTAATQSCAGNDARLSDPRTPTAHASTHGSAGSDPLTAAAIGAATASHTHAQSEVTGLPAVLDALPRLAASTHTATTYTLALADAGTAVELTSSSAVSVTVPPNSTIDFPIGSLVELLQYGTGQVTVVAGSGVTIRAPGGSLTSRAQYSTLSLRKRGTDEWVLSGDTT